LNEVDIRSLRYFLAVAHYGSYSQAAIHLQITQPAVSRQVLLMERMLNTRLFRRDGRRTFLTEAGQALSVHAQQIVDQVEQLRQVVDPATQVPSGRLNVGVPISTSEYLMPDVLQRYREKYPGVALHLVQSYGSDLTEQLAIGKLDLALLFGNPRSPELELDGLIDLEVGLVLPPENLTSAADFLVGLKHISLQRAASLPLIAPGTGQDLRRFIDEACRRQGVVPNVVMEVDGISLGKLLVGKGMGFMFLGYNGVHEEVKRGTLRYIPVDSPTLRWRLSLAARVHKRETLAARAMRTEITEAIIRGVQGHTWSGTLLAVQAPIIAGVSPGDAAYNFQNEI
jgi:LysR family nitrogen assimilation transcriptional regulator